EKSTRKLMRAFYLLALLIVLCWASLRGQTSGGSPYSAFGVGNLRSVKWGQHAGLAGLGTAWYSDAFYNYRNPAANAFIRRPYNLLFEVGMDVSMLEVADSETASWQRDGGLTHFQLWLRPHTKWTTSLGLVPYSTMRYSIFSERVLPDIGTPYSFITTGEGGLNRLFWSHSYELTPRLALGFTSSLVFGSLLQSEQVLPSADLTPFEVEVETAIRGAQFQGGLQYRLPVGDYEMLFGMTIQTGTDLLSRQTTTLFSGPESLEEIADRQQGAYHLPFSWDAGIGLANGQWQWNAEIAYQQTSTIPGDEQVDFIDTWRAGFGAEWHPRADERRDAWQGIRLRGGFSYGNSYLDIDGQQWASWEATLGMLIPVGPNRNHLSLSYAYGQNGIESAGLLHEQQHQLALSFTLRDIWFLKRKFD
ncbi:MAG: hypothetical protein AAGA62_16255, partial [Bacteroidota bacterium]